MRVRSLATGLNFELGSPRLSAHCPLLTAHCPLLTAHCPPLTVSCNLRNLWIRLVNTNPSLRVYNECDEVQTRCHCHPVVRCHDGLDPIANSHHNRAATQTNSRWPSGKAGSAAHRVRSSRRDYGFNRYLKSLEKQGYRTASMKRL